jgi:hypothetical protein
MILRKPYAFLIKNFKKIHLILTILMIYITYKCNHILAFFNEYIEERVYEYTGKLAISYINIYMYIIIILIIIVVVSILILMRQKKKPIFLYLFMIIFYLVLIIVFFQVHNYLTILEIRGLNPQTTRVLRDIIFTTYIIQIIILIFVLIRGLGFNIRKFNFGSDLAQLEVDITDNEEFELTVGVDATDIARGVRKQRREFRYFIIENIFVLTLFSVVTVITLAVFLFLNFYVYNRIYNQQEMFKVNDFIVQVNNSYYTTINYRGNEISAKNKQFLVVDMTVKNQNNVNRTISLNDVILFVNNKQYFPSTEKYDSFVDLGVGYFDQKISGGETKSYILIYEINKNEINKEMLLRWTETLYFSPKGLEAKYKKVQLVPISLDKKETINIANIDEELNFVSSFLENSILTIKGIDIADSFDYLARICIQNVCTEETRVIMLDIFDREQKTILAFEPIFNFDKTIKYKPIKNFMDFVNKFGSIRYTIADKRYNGSIKNKTPINNIGSMNYFEVTNKLNNATKIDLVFNIRNKEYIYNIK